MPLLQRAKSILDGVSTIGVILVAGIVVRDGWRPQPTANTPDVVQAIEGVDVDVRSLTKRLGQSNVMLVEFADFQCPYCGRHATSTFPRIKHELIDSGTASYAYVSFPLETIHHDALKASEAAECAAKQGKFWEMSARLYSHQSALTDADLVSHGQAVGLDTIAFTQCMSGSVENDVRADIELGNTFGVHSTPDFFVGKIAPNGRVRLTKHISGALQFDAFKQAIGDVAAERKGVLSWWPFGSRATL